MNEGYEDSFDDDFADEFDDGIDREAVAEGLAELGFQDSELLAQAAAICQRLLPTETVDPENQTPGELSQLGGIPSVPADFQWPCHDGRPLAFIAQVDFYDEEVLLLFFYDMKHLPDGKSPAHEGACRVMAVPREELSAAIVPDDLPAENCYPTVSVTMVTDINLPDYTSSLLKEHGVCEQDIKRLEELDKEQSQTREPAHHLMGYPSLLDGDMELICQLASNGFDVNDPELLLDPRVETLKTGADQWVLLFQCDADEKLGWTFGNSGRLYFWIHASDYESQNFEDVWIVRQDSK